MHQCLSYRKRQQRGQVLWLKPIIQAVPEAEIRRIGVRGQSRQNVHKTHLNQWLDMAAYACCPSYVGKHK
jgi:hypothetical protein